MTTNTDQSAEARATRLQFDRCVLDVDRGCLLLDGNEIALRPKTFAILRHLVENPGRLIAKEELFATVWPNLAVTDDVLVQSIGELRRALGDDGPRLIKTIPRRGYRFEAAVSPATDRAPSGAASTADVPAAERAHEFAARPRSAPGFFATAPSLRLGLLVSVVILLAGGVLGAATHWEFFSGRSVGSRPDIGMKPAIAVLPFQGQSGDSSREYFAEGLTQDIINALGRFPELTVMSWNAVAPYKSKPASPGEIARSLAVRYQLEGSIRQTEDRMRVTAELVDSDGRVLWSGTFDEALTDLFVLQDKITAQIAGVLAIRVTQIEQRRAFAKPTEELAAYDYVLRARPALQRPTRANNAEARTLLRRAIELDPNSAAAHAAMAATYFTDVSMGWSEQPATQLAHAEQMALKALSISDAEVRAHVILGRIHIAHHRYEQARTEMDRAIAINPNDAHALAGRGSVLMWRGQASAAIKDLELAQRIDPELNTADRFALGLAYYLERRYSDAIEQARLNLRKTEDAHFNQVVIAAAYAQQGRSDDAATAVSLLRRRDPTFDPDAFGSKFLNTADLEHLRDGLRKAGLHTATAGGSPR